MIPNELSYSNLNKSPESPCEKIDSSDSLLNSGFSTDSKDSPATVVEVYNRYSFSLAAENLTPRLDKKISFQKETDEEEIITLRQTLKITEEKLSSCQEMLEKRTNHLVKANLRYDNLFWRTVFLGSALTTTTLVSSYFAVKFYWKR